MAIYDDLIAGGLLSPSDQREAALMGLFNLGSQIGARGAARLSPTPPPLDLSKSMAVYQNSMNAALQRGALARKLRDEKALRDLFKPQPVTPAMAQTAARQAVGTVMAQPIMDDPGATGEDYTQYTQDLMAKAMPLARQKTYVPALQSLPAGIRDFVGQVGAVDPRTALTMAGNVLAKSYTDTKPSAVKEYEYAKASGFGGSFQDFLTMKAQAGAAKTYGAIPPGYRQKYNDNGEPVALEVIPGGPAAAEAQQKQQAKDKTTKGTAQTARLVVDTVDEITKIIGSTSQPVTGTMSVPFAAFSDSPAGRVRSLVEQLKSPIALGALTRLKESSKTGASGFGALNTAELTLLIDEMGRLEPNSTAPDIFLKNVMRIRDRYQSVIDDIKKHVSPEKIKELGLGPLLGIKDSGKTATRRRYNPATGNIE